MNQAPLACLHWPRPPANALRALRQKSPHVAQEGALFVLDASGLVGLYASQQQWAEALLAVTQGQGRLVLGHHATALRLLVAQLPPGTWRCSATAACERRWLGRLPLAALGLPAAALACAHRLGFATLEALEALPVGELQARLDPALAQLVATLRRPGPRPAYAAAPTPCTATWEADFPTHDAHELLFVGKRLLQPLLAQAQARRQRLACLTVVLQLAAPRGAPARAHRLVRALTPARPDNDATLWTTLLRLWLDKLQLPAAVTKVVLGGRLVAPRWTQASLWGDAPGGRDVTKAQEGLAKVRALWGDAAVVQATLQPAHLPEAQFVLRPLLPTAQLVGQHRDARTAARGADPLHWGRFPRVRRIYSTPRPLAASWLRRLQQLPHVRPCQLREAEAANVVALWPAFCVGPWHYSHAWWQRPQDRDYVYAYVDGQMLWLFFDRHARRWYCHGQVD